MRAYKDATASIALAENNKLAVPGLRSRINRAIFGPALGRSETARLWLPLVSTTVTSSAGSIIAAVFPAQFTGLEDYANWATIFGLYRIRRCIFHYTPYFAGSATNTGLMIGGVELGFSTTALGSLSAANQLDESKAVSMYKSRSWEVDLTQDGGRNDFVDTAQNLIYASFKSYSDPGSGVGISTSYGLLTGYCLVEFMGLQ